MEKWPYPGVPVYVVCPRDGGGGSWTLHSNYLLLISPNIGQDEKDSPVAGVENTNTSTPAPPVDSEPADAGPSGWSHQAQQVTHPRVVWINLLHLDMAPKKPGTNSHGGTRILVYRQIPGHPTSGMHGLVFMSYQVCTMLSGEIQCECTLLI